MTDDGLIRSNEDFSNALNAHKNYYKISSYSFVISILSAMVAVGAVYYGYTQSNLFNWVIFFILICVSFVVFMSFILSYIQAKDFEKKIKEYCSLNGLHPKIKSVKKFIVSSYFSIFAIGAIIFILHSIFVR